MRGRKEPWWGSRRSRAVALAGAALVLGGAVAVGVAVASQEHAPQPTRQAAGTTGPSSHDTGRSGTARKSSQPVSRGTSETTTAPDVVGPTLARSLPVSIAIPAIGVRSTLLDLGLNPTGTIEVPPIGDTPQTNEAAWFDGSPTPGEVGPSVIEGHIDSAYQGPSVFFRLGALVPGDTVDVTLSDGTVAVFTVSGVRQYPKTAFPTSVVYGNTDFAALRLITCGGSFDSTTHSYLSNTVVFASLTSASPAGATAPPTPPGTAGA